MFDGVFCIAFNSKGDKLHVLGIPRVNLNKVFEIASKLAIDEEQDDALPYEMIIVAVLK